MLILKACIYFLQSLCECLFVCLSMGGKTVPYDKSEKDKEPQTLSWQFLQISEEQLQKMSLKIHTPQGT